MVKTVLYTYLGTNGTVTTPIQLPNVYCVKKYQLIADEGKMLTNGENYYSAITVTQEDLDNWYEVDVKKTKANYK